MTKLRSWISYIPMFAGIAGVSIGAGVMGIWIFDTAYLQNIFLDLASMKFNTAVSFLLCSISLIVVRNKNKKNVLFINFLVSTILFIGIASIIGYIINIDIFLDELFITDPYTDIANFPGRMSIGSAIAFCLFGTAILLYDFRPRLAEVSAGITHLLALMALFGYLFDTSSLYDIFLFDTMAIHTAITFMILTVGLIFAIPNGLINSLVLDSTPGGKAVRFLLPGALLIPTIGGWLALQGIKQDWYTAPFALVIVTLMTVIILSLSIINYALSLQKWYRRLQQSQQRLLDSEIARIHLEKERELILMRERFLAMLSHDMRTPLTTIMLSTDMLLTYEERLDVDRRKRHLNKIRNQAFNILNLIEDLMLISNLQSQELPFIPMYDDIVRVCYDHFQQFSDIENLRPHEFVSNFPSEPIQTLFDANLLKRLLSNLLRNAVKYSPNGGIIECNVYAEEGFVNIVIKDTGIGIPKENQKKLFTMFNRASNVGKIVGYGLGLAIVKEIVTAHQGTILVESAVDEGSTFTVMIPIQKELQPKSLVEGAA